MNLIKKSLAAGVLLAGSLSGPNAASAEFEGEWHASVDIPSWQVWDVRSVVRFKPEGDGFVAASRPGALRDMYGFSRSLLARMMSSNLDKGAWLHLAIAGRDVDGKRPGTMRSAFTPELVMSCDHEGDGLACALADKDKPFGRLRLARNAAASLPIEDYDLLFQNVEQGLRAHHYRPATLDQAKWRKALKQLQGLLARAQDDMDVLAAWNRVAPTFPDSHVRLTRGNDAAEPQQSAPVAADESIQLSWKESVAVLRIRSFGLKPALAEQRLKEVFENVTGKSASALIVDLRGNTGGNLSSAFVAGHLLTQPTPTGYFLTQQWWAKQDALPTDAQAAAELAPLTDTDLDAFRVQLREGAGVYGTVAPSEPTYVGPVYVLIDRRTASASEPLAHVLQHTGRATLIGQRTAGAMLSSEQFELDGGWRLTVPVADYYGVGGKRLEGTGVAPDVSVDADEALDKALALIRKG